MQHQETHQGHPPPNHRLDGSPLPSSYRLAQPSSPYHLPPNHNNHTNLSHNGHNLPPHPATTMLPPHHQQQQHHHHHHHHHHSQQQQQHPSLLSASHLTPSSQPYPYPSPSSLQANDRIKIYTCPEGNT
ncbi:hypothetical protein BJ944DRAFT_290277 [Cunninghamella echinulata]|nr:hypothetical protein BJ944DRAFT_290277 [Cunninghamella echinulata]